MDEKEKRKRQNELLIELMQLMTEASPEEDFSKNKEYRELEDKIEFDDKEGPVENTGAVFYRNEEENGKPRLIAFGSEEKKEPDFFERTFEDEDIDEKLMEETRKWFDMNKELIREKLKREGYVNGEEDQDEVSYRKKRRRARRMNDDSIGMR